MAKVRILHGANIMLPPNFESWNHWWEAKKNKKLGKCSNVVCNNEATVCVHVQREDFSNTKWEVAPLCEKCSKIKGSLFVNDIDLQEIVR